MSLYKFNRLVFITETESVYSAVRTGSLTQATTVSSFGVKEYDSLQGLFLFLDPAIIITKFHISSASKTMNSPSPSSS